MDKQDIYDFLRKSGVSFEATEHEAVYTIDGMLALGLPYPELVAKNLFITDDKKQNFYLICVREDRTINLKAFKERFGTRRLRFASEEALTEKLELIKGAVTPFGLLNDATSTVQLFIGEELLGKDGHGHLGIHPNDNTATVWMATEDLIDIIRAHNNPVTVF